jgi:hypothetical protein
MTTARAGPGGALTHRADLGRLRPHLLSLRGWYLRGLSRRHDAKAGSWTPQHARRCVIAPPGMLAMERWSVAISGGVGDVDAAMVLDW